MFAVVFMPILNWLFRKISNLICLLPQMIWSSTFTSSVLIGPTELSTLCRLRLIWYNMIWSGVHLDHNYNGKMLTLSSFKLFYPQSWIEPGSAACQWNAYQAGGIPTNQFAHFPPLSCLMSFMLTLQSG